MTGDTAKEKETGSERDIRGERGSHRRSLFVTSAQRVLEITQPGEITFSFCPRLGQRHEKKKGTIGARKNTSLKRWTRNKKQQENEGRTLLILPRKDSMSRE